VNKAIMIIGVLALLALLPRLAGAQGLTEEEVQAVMEDPYVQSAFKNCVVGQSVAESTDVILIINEKGKAALAFVEPEVVQDVFGCFQKIIQTLQFKATGQKFEITYPLEFPGGGTPAVGTTPPPDTGTPALGTVPDRGATVQPAGTYTPPPPVGGWETSISFQFWKKELKKGKTFMAVGGVLLGLGVGAMMGGAIAYYFYAGDHDTVTTAKVALVIGIVAGIALIYGGLHLFITGKKRVNKARSVLQTQYVSLIPIPALTPTPLADGIAGSLLWRF
jgi:hypothetical protein